MSDRVARLITAFEAEYPGITRETIGRQVQDAVDSVDLFGFDGTDIDGLVERLVRSHLDALAALRSS